MNRCPRNLKNKTKQQPKEKKIFFINLEIIQIKRPERIYDLKVFFCVFCVCVCFFFTKKI